MTLNYTSEGARKLRDSPKFGKFNKKKSGAAKTFVRLHCCPLMSVFESAPSDYSFTGSEERYFLTMSAILKMIA